MSILILAVESRIEEASQLVEFDKILREQSPFNA